MEAQQGDFSVECGIKPTEIPLAKESTFTRRSDLQGQLLGLSSGKFPEKPLSADEIKQKLTFDIYKRWDWDTFKKISLQERKETAEGTVEKWKQKFIAWVEGRKHDKNYSLILQEVLKKLGIDEVNNETLEVLLDQYATADDSRLDLFVQKLIQIPELEKKIHVIKDVAGCLFGREISAEICSQIVDLEKQIHEMGGDETKLANLAQSLSNAAKTPTDATKQLIEKIKEWLERWKKQTVETAVKLEGETMPDNAGSKAIANRGKEFNPKGQDRIRYEKLENGIEVFSVCDGAGINGHEVAEFVGKKLGELLKETNPDVLDKSKLIEICQRIQNEVLSKFHDSGSTADVIIKLPNKKNFAIHVGEGNIGKISMNEDTGERPKNLDKGRIPPEQLGEAKIFQLIFQEHRVGPQDQKEGAEQDNDGIWRIRGSKTKSFGVPCRLTFDVEELEPGGYIIMSDGLSEILPKISYSPDEFMRLYNDSPQKAIDYLVTKAQEYATSIYHSEADDISAIIVKV